MREIVFIIWFYGFLLITVIGWVKAGKAVLNDSVQKEECHVIQRRWRNYAFGYMGLSVAFFIIALTIARC